jgi:c(7)-type cytochrome triheme protein
MAGMAVHRQSPPPRPRNKFRLALVLAGLVAGAAWITDAALAQGAGAPASAWKVQLPRWPGDLFGAQPEASTEPGPPPPVHDPANPDYPKLQQPNEAFGALPKDARERPDWMRALREGLIQPRANKQAGGPDMQVLDLDILMKNTAQMPYVKFPHRSHTMWLACTNCHDGLFVPKAGANPTTMPRILAGESCGVCHSKVAFTAMFTCERCHSVAQPGQTPWW